MTGIKGQKVDRATNLEAHRDEVNPPKFSMSLPHCVTPDPESGSCAYRGPKLTRAQAIEGEPNQGRGKLPRLEYEFPGKDGQDEAFHRPEDGQGAHSGVVNP